jgi:hypothetical protein
MKFVSYDDADTIPNLVVDGAAARGTVLTLSHWPKSGTPPALRADTSAEIVFNYLDTPGVHVDVEAVSNNHFDEDGLIGVFALTEPALAADRRALLLEAARAGDFGVSRSRQAARLAFVLAAYADPRSSPLPQSTFAGSHQAVTARLYREMLHALPHVMTHVEDFQSLWQAEDRAFEQTDRYIDAGVITIEPHDDLDLAIVRVPADVPAPHPMALHTRTPRSRLIVVHGASVELRYRYESWVQFVSRPIAPRIDLTPLAADLTEREVRGRWVFDGVDQITPRLYLDGASTSIPVDTVIAAMEHALRTGPAAWNPYD